MYLGAIPLSGQLCQRRLSGRTNCPACRSPRATSTNFEGLAFGACTCATTCALRCAAIQARPRKMVANAATSAMTTKTMRRGDMRVSCDDDAEGERLLKSAAQIHRRHRPRAYRHQSAERREMGERQQAAGDGGHHQHERELVEAGPERRRGEQ